MENEQFVIYPHPENSEPQPDLDPKDKLVYVAIRRYMNSRTMEAFPSYATIRKDTGAAPNTIKKCVDNLIREGYIETRRRGKYLVYKFNNNRRFEPYSYNFLDNPNLTFTEKAYIVASHQYMFKDGNEGKIEYSNKELSALIHMPATTIGDCNRSLEAKGYLEGASEFIKRFPQDKLNLIFIEKFKEQDERMDNIEDEVRMLREELARLKKERELERNVNTQMIL